MLRKVEMSSSTRSAKRYSNIMKDMTREFGLSDSAAEKIYMDIISEVDLTLEKRGHYIRRILNGIPATRGNKGKASTIIYRIQRHVSPTRSRSPSPSSRGGSRKQKRKTKRSTRS
jgi:hypothetical protein